jgi:hypothetical protein
LGRRRGGFPSVIIPFCLIQSLKHGEDVLGGLAAVGRSLEVESKGIFPIVIIFLCLLKLLNHGWGGLSISNRTDLLTKIAESWGECPGEGGRSINNHTDLLTKIR